jgi:hypothetical protein
VATGALAVMTCVTLSGCSSTPDTSPAQPTAAASPSTSSSAAPESDLPAKCRAKTPANAGDILFRFKDPGTDWNAQRLGGGYAWNAATNTCLATPDFFISTVPDGPGHCGQVAMASDNPTYDENAVPAGPLHNVIAEKGSCRH